MTSGMERVGPEALLARLHGVLPGAQLAATPLPLVPEITLWLLEQTYPADALDAEAAATLMDEPPYWSFCWASGQVLARYLLDHPALVAGKTVVDVGPGSGVVAIAAALAGAARVVACDLDPVALAAVDANAALNSVSVRCSGVLADCLPGADLITAADILYDRDNLPLLAQLRMAGAVLLADSRIRDLQPPGYQRVGEREATTWPDLDESREFNCVRLFAAGGNFPEP